jgi:hypothetical protein
MRVTKHIAVRLVLATVVFIASAGMQMDLQRQTGDSSSEQLQSDQTDSQSTMEILPASYIGCWRGVVNAPDMLQNLNGCLNGPSVPELYTLCYRKTLNGKFEVTFGEVELDSDAPRDYKVSGTHGKIEVLSTDGIARVSLRSIIHFDQKQPTSKSNSDSKWSMDERTDMACQIDGETMEVGAAFTQTSDGADCFRGTWHAHFKRFDD